MNDYIALALGVICAGLGGELFVRGSVNLAQWARISPGLIGATVAAFATSSPELSVGVNAAMAGKPEISLGDVLGSNVVNVALILGLALSLSGIRSSRDRIKRDFAGALLVPVVTALLAIDGTLSRLDGVLLLLMFFVWLGLTVREALRDRSARDEGAKANSWWITIAQNVAGLVLLVTAGNLIVFGAKSIAHTFGISDFVIGATVVAVGTSVPELATTLIAKLRGQDEIGLGAVFGSNIFNGLLIVGVVAMIAPIQVNLWASSIALTLSMVAVACTFPRQNQWISRRRGFALLGLYAIYLGLILKMGI